METLLMTAPQDGKLQNQLNTLDDYGNSIEILEISGEMGNGSEWKMEIQHTNESYVPNQKSTILNWKTRRV